MVSIYEQFSLGCKSLGILDKKGTVADEYMRFSSLGLMDLHMEKLIIFVKYVSNIYNQRF